MTNKAKRAVISIAGIEVEVFQMPNGEYAMSQTQVAQAINMVESGFRRFLQSKEAKVLLGNDLGFVAISIAGTGRAINAVPINIVSLFWNYQSHNGSDKAFALVNACVIEALERRYDNAWFQK
ncbi:hypothetical protein JYQ62_16085 [Nostoc sp. UHCC 0702]|nr:hypothetical protein JYQ62_16085 [Nostoc sp. UHCC 0702]